MKILFIHHSTGGNLIKQGNLRGEIEKFNARIEFWDHSYNLYPVFSKFLAAFTHHKGLSDSKGRVTGKDYDIVLSNNSPKEYAEIFSRNPNNPTLQAILSYDVIVFKNCFPTTHITTDKQLEDDKNLYKIIRDNLGNYSNKQFILFTPPPVRAEATMKENAARAKSLVSWLISNDFLKGIKNIHVFDFFGLLADKDGVLKQMYAPLLPFDSHPNKKANQTVSSVFAKYLAETLAK